MPMYEFVCNKCQKNWEDFLTIEKREEPLKNPCPHCKAEKCVEKQWMGMSPSINADMTLTPNKATGGRWNELMAKMKSGLPQRYARKLDAPNNATGRRWKG